MIKTIKILTIPYNLKVLSPIDAIRCINKETPSWRLTINCHKLLGCKVNIEYDHDIIHTGILIFNYICGKILDDTDEVYKKNNKIKNNGSN